jgi:transcriptional regulator with XRE-family HTH domain
MTEAPSGAKDPAKVAHGRALKDAMSRRSMGRETVAAAVGVKPRTITNWTSGTTMPEVREREILRKLLGPYDTAGDQVEVALAHSNLTEDRRYEVLALYKRLLRQQFLDEAM